MKNRGNGSISILIVMMIMMFFIVLPLISIVFENYYISIISREIVDASNASISATFDSIDIAKSTKYRLDYDLDTESKFKEFLIYNLVLDDSLKSQNGKFLGLEVTEFSNVFAGEKDPLSSIRMDKQTIHVTIKLDFEPMFLMTSIRKKQTVDIHFDYEIPIDN